NFKKLTDIEYEELLKEKVRSLRNSEILKHEFYKKELEADFKRDKNFIENLTFEEEYAKSRASQDDEYSMIQYNKQITEKQIDKEVEDLLRFNFKHGIPDSLEIIQEKAKTQI
ncbi:MAG: hypothetical protein FWC57_06500, partial [Endomicrobia bacterium]|nr:hypothetical protein [Endomicrobiia bacterium]